MEKENITKKAIVSLVIVLFVACLGYIVITQSGNRHIKHLRNLTYRIHIFVSFLSQKNSWKTPVVFC